MKILKLIFGVPLVLMGVLAFFGHGQNPDGSPVTDWQKVQDKFGAGLLLLIGASLLISASRKKKEEE
jgi:hypothetical protein